MSAILRTTLLAVSALAGGACGGADVPRDAAGRLVFVSDRDGRDALYLRRLPDGPALPLLRLDEPLGEPAFSPDGRRVAFSMRGRIGVVDVASGALRFLSVGVDWRDSAPAWRPDGAALVVSSRRGAGADADLHLLEIPPTGPALRRPLLETRLQSELSPSFSPDGAFVAFVRDDGLFRLDLRDGQVRRLTGGFRRMRRPCFLASGRLASLWTEGKQFGIDALDADGAHRETLLAGTVFYRTLTPSPDGRYWAATLGFESESLSLSQHEEVRLLDASGRNLATLARSWRSNSHSPSWAR